MDEKNVQSCMIERGEHHVHIHVCFHLLSFVSKAYAQAHKQRTRGISVPSGQLLQSAPSLSP